MGAVGTAQIAPPLPKNRKPGPVPGFFVPAILASAVRYQWLRSSLARSTRLILSSASQNVLLRVL